MLNNADNDTVAYTNKTRFYSNTDGGSVSGYMSGLEIFQGTANADAFMTFHVGGDYAGYFGLDGTTNDLFWGGWSNGAAVKNKVWHAGNDGSGSGLDADTLDGVQASGFITTSTAQPSQIAIRNGSPTIYLRDTDHNSAMLHCNSDIFYVLRGGDDTTTWSQVNGAWPMELNLTNNNATFGGQMHVKGNLDMASDSTTSARYVNLPRGGGITFYGNGSVSHSITSRNSSGTATDDLFMQSYGGIFLGLDSNNNNSSSADFKIVTNGNTASRLTFSGENYGLTVSGNVTAYSDARLKENVELIPDALEKVQKLRGVTFTRNDHKDTERRHVGVIAQEVEAVLPEAVWDGEEGIKNVAYGNMVGLLIEAVKELKAEVEELKGNA